MPIRVLSTTATTTTLARNCPFCGAEQTLTIDTTVLNRGIELYQKGALLQNAFPTLNSNEREFFKTGICSTCWEKM